MTDREATIYVLPVVPIERDTPEAETDDLLASIWTPPADIVDLREWRRRKRRHVILAYSADAEERG